MGRRTNAHFQKGRDLARRRGLDVPRQDRQDPQPFCLPYYNPKLDPDVNFIKAIDAWNDARATISYQAIAKTMEMEQLLGVNGDEDNPTNPRDVE